MKLQKTPCSFDYPRMILRPDSLYFPWPSECARASARMYMCVHTHTQRVFGAQWRHNLEMGLARIREPGPAHVSLTQKTALHREKEPHSPLTKRIINSD